MVFPGKRLIIAVAIAGLQVGWQSRLKCFRHLVCCRRYDLYTRVMSEAERSIGSVLPEGNRELGSKVVVMERKQEDSVEFYGEEQVFPTTKSD